jgi:hypothetical protein
MAASDALIEGIAGAIGACISLTATYPLLTVSTLRALELRDDKDSSSTLASKLRAVPGPVRDVIQVGSPHLNPPAFTQHPRTKQLLRQGHPLLSCLFTRPCSQGSRRSGLLGAVGVPANLTCCTM